MEIIYNIELKKRLKHSLGTRLFNMIIGILILICGFIIFINKHDLTDRIGLLLFIIGIFYIFKAVVGISTFKENNRLRIDSEYLIIKSTSYREQSIPRTNINKIYVIPNKIEIITVENKNISYNLSWLKDNEKKKFIDTLDQEFKNKIIK